MKGIVQKEARVARKKQHLRYQAKKGRLQTANQADEVEKKEGVTKVGKKQQQAATAKMPQAAQRPEFTKLPASETQFVRREIVYIGFIALVLLILYVLIFLAFRFTGLDEWLSGLVQLKN